MSKPTKYVTAADYVVPFGKYKGKRMGSLPTPVLCGYGLLGKDGNAVSAITAAVIRNSRIVLKNRREDKKDKELQAQIVTHYTDDAKHRSVECNRCQHKERIASKLLDRRARVACDLCGGTMVEVNSSPVCAEDLATIKNVAVLLHVAPARVRQLIKQNNLPKFKYGASSLVSVEAVRRCLILEYSSTSEDRTACDKTFRNPAARKLHEEECPYCQAKKAGMKDPLRSLFMPEGGDHRS